MINYDAGRSWYGTNKKLGKLIPEIKITFSSFRICGKLFRMFRYTVLSGFILHIQCNLDLVTLLVSAKTVTKSHNVTKLNAFM